MLGMGLFRKVAIADPAGMLADTYFANPSTFPTIPLACGLVLHGLKIYNDFAGYSDMARGAAWLFGFDLMRNFRQPYFAKNIADFWKRWHISLSTWLRDYLYPIRWKQKRPSSDDDQFDADDVAGRSVARGKLEFRYLGRSPRDLPRGPSHVATMARCPAD